jgi:hypothetical protein
MKAILSVCAFLLAGSVTACSVYMEATRPTPTDLNYFQVGMTRDQVVQKLGAPDTTAIQPDDQTSCDFYKLYTRGYGAAGKVPIAVAEAAADVFTVGLAEIALTPAEGVTKNEKHPVQFCYKGQELVRIVTDTPPTASPDQNPPLAVDQNPPITAASTATPGTAPSSAASGTAVATPSPSPGAEPTGSASLATTPSSTPSSTAEPSPSAG